MHSSALFEITAFLVLGIGSYWLGWRLRLPVILFLLVAGILAGPVFGILQPDALFGDLLLPFVSLSVALILFEGGLTLRLSELPLMGGVAWRLVTVGAMVTLVVAILGAHFIVGLGWSEAALLGSILIVTGPTVIGPMLRHIRPIGPVGPTLKWEGIVIDPIGATLAVLVFEAILARENTPAIIVLGVVKTIVVGISFGFAGAAFLVSVMRRYWIPDHLQVAATLAVVVAAFTASNHLQQESGLLAVTAMGVFMANQKRVPVHSLVEFKEHLRVLILSSVFVVLAARLEPREILELGPRGMAFVAVLMLVARPLCVALSTWGSRLTARERLFLAWVAPRGIVAASVASVFALRLGDAGYPDAARIAPITFLVIGVTVLVYGLTSGMLAQGLGLSVPNPQGCLIIGAHRLAQRLAKALQAEGFHVTLVDTNWGNVTAARQEGLTVYYGDALADTVLDELSLEHVGRVLALTANNETNVLAMLHFADIFERSELYQLSPGKSSRRGKEEDKRPKHLKGRTLFGEAYTFELLHRLLDENAVVKTTALTKEFGYEDFRREYGELAMPLFLVSRDGKRLVPVTTDREMEPVPGQKVVSLVRQPSG